MNAHFFVTCAPGLEPVLHEEVKRLRFGKHERQVGGVAFQGRIEDAWRANLELRTAIRVLMRIARFPAKDADALHRGASEVDWSQFLSADGSLVVHGHAKDSVIDHSLFVAQRVKDAVCDQFRARDGRRPDVDKHDPDLRLVAHLSRNRCTLLVDTSGPSLHKRGWRKFQGRAPLAETSAAAMVLRSGWNGRAPLVDPFCGSGTILIEAAHIAGDVAPGLSRKSFAFERLPGFRADRWNRMRDEARDRVRFPAKLTLFGSDRSEEALEGALENLESAGVADRVELRRQDALAFPAKPGWNAWIVTNPPYGERVGEVDRLWPLYRALGDRFREECEGYHLTMLSGNEKLAGALRLPGLERVAVMNGAIECQVITGELNADAAREPGAEDAAGSAGEASTRRG